MHTILVPPLLRDAPRVFALLGTSMGGYVALEVMRQEPARVTALALVSTSARADTPEQVVARQRQSQLVEDGHFEALVDAAFHGADDRSIPINVARETASSIPDARLTVIEDAGHFLFYEQSAATATAVTELLDQIV